MRDSSENAVMAKVKALYGKRLKPEDYDGLVHLKSVAEVAGYLKSNTCYADALAEVKEELIHRGQLENFVRRRNLNIYTRLLKYAYRDRLFLKMYMMQNEIRQLLLAIRFLNAGSMDRYIVALPAYLSKYMSFDMFSLARATDYDSLLAITERSGYRNILARFRPRANGEAVDIAACEKALLEYYYRILLRCVKEDYSGDTRASLTAILYSMADFHNLSAAYRLKRFFGYSANDVRENMLDIKTGLNFSRAYDKLLNASGEAEIDEALNDAYVAGKFKLNPEDRELGMSIRMERGRMAISRKDFRFSTEPMAVAISYMFMLEIELSNIVNIIEGIRYNLAPDNIRGLLVIS